MKLEKIKELLTELIIYKKNGNLDISEILKNENAKYKGILNYDIFNKYMRHGDQEIKLQILQLLVESRKSTLNFSSSEFDLIIIFLTYNLGEKIEYVPLIKKCLNRVRDSLAVIRRKLMLEEKSRRYAILNNLFEKDAEVMKKSYQTSELLETNIESYFTFLIALRNLCTDNLYIDATYIRRKSCLQILCLMKDILDHDFINLSWKSEYTGQIFLWLMLDTYESNKEMAFQVLQSLKDESLLKLDEEETVLKIIQLAFSLGNSIRPIDSVTATYILKICMLSSKLNSVLTAHYKNDYISVTEVTPEVNLLQIIFTLIVNLDRIVVNAKSNLTMTVKEHSIYGYLFCIRSLLNECNLEKTNHQDSWKKIFTKLINVSIDLSDAVSIIVNNSSPEGHLPMDLASLGIGDCNTSKDNTIPQMLLLCSWRTVKEVSLLFGLLASKILSIEATLINKFLTDDEVIQIGEHLVTLLCETKHRGAFEQAHVGFYQLCTQLWRLNIPKLQVLPMTWLHIVLLAILGFSENSKLCVTRRSAGLPFMIQALLASEPNKKNKNVKSAFDSVMKILLRFTKLEALDDVYNNVGEKVIKGMKLLIYHRTIFSDYISKMEDKINVNELSVNITDIKVHALNILRALFRHSQLGDLVKPYISDGLITAFQNYNGITWAERNAATLLFSALIIRIFGVQRTKDHVNLTDNNKMTEKVFFEKYPFLLTHILNELHSFVSTDYGLIKPSVQSILLLLSRLYRDNNSEESIQGKTNEFVMLVSQCAKSPVYKTRELAARALVPLLTKESAFSMILELFDEINANKEIRGKMNTNHGYMIQILEIIRNDKYLTALLPNLVIPNFVGNTKWILKSLYKESKEITSYPLAAAYIDVIHELMKMDSLTIVHNDVQDLFYIIGEHVENWKKLKNIPGQDMYKSSLINFIVFIKEYLDCKPVQYDFDISVCTYWCILNDSEPKARIIGWSSFSKILVEISDYYEKKRAFQDVLNIFEKSLDSFHKYNPDLQDAMFNFLFDILSNSTNFCQDNNDLHIIESICELVLNRLRNEKIKNYMRNSYLRLLGKAFVIYNLEFNHMSDISVREYVYESFCNELWIKTLNEDFRSSVFDIMTYLFFICQTFYEEISCTLDWWTTILKLLLDDNIEIRRDASKVLCEIEPSLESMCSKVMVKEFFNTFYRCTESHPVLASVTLLYWSTSIFEKETLEMDETKVFNKSGSSEYLEPVQIVDMCVERMKLIFQEHSIDKPLASDVLRWIDKRFEYDRNECTTIESLIHVYNNSHEKYLNQSLEHIADPMCKDKLIQGSICKKLNALLHLN